MACLALGVVVWAPSVVLAFQAGLVAVQVGDTLALGTIAMLSFWKGLGYRRRSLGLAAVLYLLGVLLLVLVGPISQIYLLGFSLMATLLLGLNAGLWATALNAVTLAGLGYAGKVSPTLVPPAWIGETTDWGVVSLNFVVVNTTLVLAIGMVLRKLELGLERESTARASLQHREALLRMASRVGRLGAWDIALPSRAVRWSAETRSILGVDDAFVPNLGNAMALYVPGDRPDVEAAIERCATEGAPFEIEPELVTTKGRRSVHIIGEAVVDHRGVIVAIQGAIQDVTEARLLERRSLRAQRLESIGTLAGGIAHDLNNVLTPILMSVESLREGETDPRKLEDFETVESCARRGADMVRQLVLFARGEQPTGRLAVDLVPVVHDVLRIVRESLPKGLSVVFDAGPMRWRVSGDETQMHQLVMNLCVNARDAMPNGGSLAIRLAEVVLDEADAALPIDASPGAYVVLRVEDTGPGMPREVQDRIFEPFFTTKEVGKGTGLGLSTCHGIVRSHGGFIQLASEPGAGTRFEVYLPANVPQTPSASRRSLPGSVSAVSAPRR